MFVSEVTTPAGCTEEGVLTYTAAFTNSAFETKTKTETIPALGHDWTDPVYQWSENNDSCTATRTCRNDESHIETETVESVVTWVAPTVYAEGSMTYSVTFESLHFEKQERVFTIPKLSKDGWVKEDGVWKYYKNDEAVTGWNKVGQKWYYMNAEGAMQTGWQKISKKWYYFNSSGAMQTGWQTIKNKKYYFNPSGAMQTGWQKIDSKWYYFESSGSMVTGWKQLSSKWYYFGTDGIMQTGWKTISGKTYYFKSSGVMAANEWYNGWWLNKDGTWTYKYKGSWHQNSKGWWFGDESGWYAKNTTITINNKQYTFDANGYMK